MSLELVRIQVRDHWGALAALWDAHWRDAESAFSATPPAPRREVYEALEERGELLVVGAFSDGELVGYAAALVGAHPRYGWTFADLEVLYLAPEHRRGHAGRGLLDALWEECRSAGAEVLLIGARPSSPLDAICLHAGWSIDQVVYRRRS